MREFITLFSPQWWTFKNRLFRSDWTAYLKSIFVLALGAGFWFAALHYLTIVLTRLQGMEGNVGVVIALKGLSLLLMLVFFLLIFSSLLSGINNFYLSNDLPVILASPVSWESIYIAKWVETAVKSSLIIVCAIVPVFISLGWFFESPAGYYFYLLPVLTLFVMIPVGIGIVISILLMAFVPAKRARNVFLFLGLLMLAILFLLFRFLRPERFANPEWFANLAIFLSEMKLPAAVFLPSVWATESLTSFFNAEGGEPLFYFLLLLFTAGVFIIFGHRLFTAFFYNGLIKAQQTQKPWLGTHGNGPGGFGAKMFSFSLSFLKKRSRALIEKDMITFFRNVSQSSQLLLLFAIVFIYLFSIKALPVEWGTYLSLQLKYIISFFNIGIVAFVITAIAARLVLPSVDNEGKAFWIIRVSPVSMGRFLWNKFLAAFFPLLILAQLLIVISNIFLGVKMWFMVLGMGTGLVLTASITGLAIGIGAYAARFALNENGREQTGFQGTAFMLSALALIVITILLEIVPVTGMFLKEIGNAALTAKGSAVISLLFLLVFAVNTSALWLAMRMGEKRLAALE